ncbi:MAG: DUF2480 family protein [Bacteroidetes bacterium]|nr:DUF2480 family protein [Bacteroidota bacterium]
MDIIKNKVAESGIITLDLSTMMMEDTIVAEFDLKPFLFREMILKEKDYRASLQTHDWEQYKNKTVAIFCSVDAIIPVWAYMLAASYLQPLAKTTYFGTKQEMIKYFLLKCIEEINTMDYEDKRVVIKGCGDIQIPDAAYVAVTNKLRPVVKSLMYGEPCSTVPIYKKSITKQEG